MNHLLDYKRSKRIFKLSIKTYINIVAVLSFFLFWEITARIFFSSSRSFPPPSKVLNGFLFWINSGEFISDILISLARISVGFGLGSLLGIIIGSTAALVAPIRWFTNPILQMLRPIPPIALVTLSILWFGIGETSKYFLVTWTVFFQVWISTYSGVLKVERHLIWAGLSLGARDITLLKKVILPAALPSILLGLRTGIGVAYFSLIASELAGSYGGLGFRIDISTAFFRSDVMMAAIITLGIVGALSDALFVLVINLFFPWNKDVMR